MCSEYDWEFDYVDCEIHLAYVFVLYARIAVRHGNKLPGPSYGQQEIINATRRALGLYEKNTKES